NPRAAVGPRTFQRVAAAENRIPTDVREPEISVGPARRPVRMVGGRIIAFRPGRSRPATGTQIQLHGPRLVPVLLGRFDSRNLALLLDKWQQVSGEHVVLLGIAPHARPEVIRIWKLALDVLKAHRRQAELAKVAAATCPPGGLAGLLDGGQQ